MEITPSNSSPSILDHTEASPAKTLSLTMSRRRSARRRNESNGIETLCGSAAYKFDVIDDEELRLAKLHRRGRCVRGMASMMGLASQVTKALIFKNFFGEAVGCDKKLVTPTRDTNLDLTVVWHAPFRPSCCPFYALPHDPPRAPEQLSAPILEKA